MFLHSVFFFALLFLGTNADIPVCNGAVQLNPPADTTQDTWYPSNFTGSPPPLYPNNYSCTYQINVPQGWSATISIWLNQTIPSDQAVSVVVIDQNQQSEAVWPTTGEHYFFLAPGGRITLASRQSNVRFGFSIRWWQFYGIFDPWHNKVTVAQPQPAVSWAFSTSPIQTTAETRVSLVITPPIDDNLLQYLRSIIIYDGPNWNSTCLGNGLQLYFSRKQLVSTGKQMTVVQLRPFFPLGRTMLVFQDYENTKDIVQFQGINCPDVANCGMFTMDGTQGPAAMVSLFETPDSGAEYITSLSGSGQLDVYIGGKTKSKTNLITSYAVNSSSQLIPQEFLGYARTYVFTGKTALVGFTRRSQVFSNSAAVGRKGFMASRSYMLGAASFYQDVYDTIGSNYPSYTVFNFQVVIQEADFVGNTTLSVVVRNQGKTTYSQVFTASNLPDTKSTISAIGTDLSVDYKTYGQATKGYFLNFELQKSSAQYGLFATLFLFLMLQ